MSLRKTFKKRVGSSARRAAISTISCVALVTGCTNARDLSADKNVDVSLAALMADGPLPAGMAGGADRSAAPQRFCDFQFPDGDDAGVGFPDDPMMGAGGIGGAGMAGPTGGAAGTVAVGGMSGGVAGAGAAGMPGAGGGTAGAAGMSAAGTGAAGTGMGGSPGDGDGDGDGEGSSGCESEPIGFWRFDDCNESRTELQDSGNEGHTAFRTIDLACAETQQGLGPSFVGPDDMVFVPDQPAFGLDQGVTFAAWVRPNRITGTSTIARKRDDANSAFALVIQAKKYQFIVKLQSGQLATVSAPAQKNRWTHVAATFDGGYLRLYLDGVQANEVAVTGTLAPGDGPLLMGNDFADRKLDGLIDNAWFNTLAAPADTIMRLTCLSRPPTFEITPAVSDPVIGGTTVDYELHVTNNNAPVCDPEQFVALANLPQELTTDNFFTFLPQVASGETITAPFPVTSGEETEPDTYPFQVQLFSFSQGFVPGAIAEAAYVVSEPTGCFVRSSRVLTIRDVSVVDDPIRTAFDGDPDDPATGAWTFGRMMERLSPTDADGPEMTERLFGTFLTTQTINGFDVQPREAMDPVVLQPWPRTPDGQLDLTRAPMRLLAIVNRLDLKDLARNKAGEGRLVYGVLDESGFPMEFTVIFEYVLPGSTEAEHRAWAEDFHALQELPFPSEEYNAALQAITDRFSSRGAFPGAPNDSALIDIRTNEIALSFQWELREFRLSADGLVTPATVFQTPDQSFNFTDTLGRFINENEASIVAETHEAPLMFEGAPFNAGTIFNNIDFWDAPGINNPEARHKLSLNTCNGCHGGETNTAFLQIFPRFAGEQSFLSGFLTGTTVFDPVTGEPRRMAELSRRRGLMQDIVCAP